MVGMIGTSRIQDLAHPRQAGKAIGNGRRIGLRGGKADLETVHAALGEPAVKRAGRHAPCDRSIIDCRAMFRVTRRHITKGHVRMPGQKFGHRMDDDIGAVIKRAEHSRCCKGIVDNKYQIMTRGECSNAGYIRNPQGRV